MKNLVLNHPEKNRKVSVMDLVKKAAIAVLVALIVTFYYLCYHFIFK
ncbi:hypothetical protein ACNQGB_20575 [Flavobacterium sp. XS1P32]